MKILAWDTSTAVSAVALLEGTKVVARDTEQGPARHGDTLLPRVVALMSQAGWRPRQVELIAVGLGPGSFTGLRVGLATAKGWSLATGVPLVGLVSHAAIADPLLADGRTTVAVITDAFKGEVYVTIYHRAPDGSPEAKTEPFHAAPATAARAVAERVPTGSITVVGDGLRRYPKSWSEVLGSRADTVPPTADVPCPVSLSRLAAKRLSVRGPSELQTLAPVYVRDSDAKLPDTPLSC